ncbi:MAG: hypothetical protein ACK4F4_08170 [Hylemonella sp.]|jgi:hypothetical protein|uniref:hypothetical protein n=1 Tax=Hylemonella sp. TaxID=2066020 RepID=UPI00391CACCE
MELKEAGLKWEELHQRWVVANQEARRMEMRILVRYKSFAEGKGPAPSADDLARAEQLRREANDAQADRDEFTRRIFR